LQRRAPGPLQVALLLGFIGLVAFGGPAAHVALMRRELVERRHWLEADRFSRMFAACNLIPGPSSTELAMFIGYRMAGIRGLLGAGAFFIAPAMAIMLALAWAYARYANTWLLQAILYGVRPVVVAVVAWAALDLARKMLARRWLLILAALSLSLFLIGLNPVLILGLVGMAALAVTGFWRLLGRDRSSTMIALAPILFGPHPERLPQLFFTFLKIGAVTFGSGYVLYAFLQADFVSGLHWLKPGDLVAAVAIGQITPGPVFTTATFLGYLFAGIPGALLATVAIFLPGLLLVPFLDRLVSMIEARRSLRILLDGVNAAVIGLIIGVGYQLGLASVHDWLTAAIALVAFPLILWKPLATPAVVAGGAAIGLAALGLH
jgi:chromate transporter